MDEEKIKYIRGVEGRGEEIFKLFESMGCKKICKEYLCFEDPNSIYFIEYDSYVARIKKDSTVSKLIIAHGEELFLPAKFKYKLGDRVQFTNKRGSKIVGNIARLEDKEGNPHYVIYVQNGCVEAEESELELYTEPQVKTWDDLVGKPMKGYYIGEDSTLEPIKGNFRDFDRNVATTEKVAKAMLAMAQISQLLPYYDTPITDEEWNDITLDKYCIIRAKNKVKLDACGWYYQFLAFHTEEQRDEFLANNPKLVHEFLMLDYNDD